MNLNTKAALQTVRSDDFIEYFLFPNINGIDSSQNDDNLQTICEQIQQIATKYSESYIWHKDSFSCTPRFGNANLLTENQLDDCGNIAYFDLFRFRHAHDKKSIIHFKFCAANSIVSPHIYGITHYEDNIQDEWFIVSLLFEISRQIPDLIIRCIDGDGEFMLIEAAECLPNWANPDTCEGCVSFNRQQANNYPHSIS